MIAPRIRVIAKVSNLIPRSGSKRLDRADQADQAVGNEVGVFDVRRQPRAEPAGDELDHRRVGDDQPLAGALVPVVFVAPPQVAELNLFHARFHQAILRSLAGVGSCAGVACSVGVTQSGGVDSGVNLGGRDRRVA